MMPEKVRIWRDKAIIMGGRKKKKGPQNIRAGHPHRFLTATYKHPAALGATTASQCSARNGAGGSADF